MTKGSLWLQPCLNEDAALLRFLKARKFDVAAAADQLESEALPLCLDCSSYPASSSKLYDAGGSGPQSVTSPCGHCPARIQHTADICSL